MINNNYRTVPARFNSGYMIIDNDMLYYAFNKEAHCNDVTVITS